MVYRLCALTVFFLLFLHPVISWGDLEIPETRFNFGEVNEKQIVEHVFKIKNNSKIPVEILSVSPDCGCTVADYSKRIEPGETGYVKLVINTKGFKGQITKSSIVRTTDEQKKEFVLVLEGKVRVPIDVSTHNVLFYGPDTKGQKKVITIEAKKSEPLELKFLNSSLEGKVSYTLKEVERGKLYRLELVCLEGPEANFTGEINFQTNYKEEPEIKIMVRKMAFKK